MAFQTVWYDTNLPEDIISILEKDLKVFENTFGDSAVGYGGQGEVNKGIRNSKNVWIPTSHWIGGFLWHYAARANRENFLYDLTCVDGENLQEYLDSVMEANDYEIELVESDEDFGEEGDYTLHMMSSEKGTFFEGRFETIGEFDPKKLKVIITEYPNGEDTVTSILYNDVDVENDGGDTNGKGYYAAVWSNINE